MAQMRNSVVRELSRSNWLLGMTCGEDCQPSPKHDFTRAVMALASTEFDDGKLCFGFLTPEHAREWFGEEQLVTMAQHGFKLRQVSAAKVWESTSRKQIAFIPAKVGRAKRVKGRRSP